MNEKLDRIRTYNDRLRKFQLTGKIHLTGELASIDGDLVPGILQALAEFDSWPEGNDPYGEHDFGSFRHTIAGLEEEIAFKIDYFNRDMTAGSEDPSDLDQTTRVLSIFYLRDY